MGEMSHREPFLFIRFINKLRALICKVISGGEKKYTTCIRFEGVSINNIEYLTLLRGVKNAHMTLEIESIINNSSTVLSSLLINLKLIVVFLWLYFLNY